MKPSETQLVLRNGEVVEGHEAYRHLIILRDSYKDDPGEPSWLVGLANKDELDESERNIEGITKDGVMDPVLKAVVLNAALVEGDKITLRDPFMSPEQDHETARHNHRLLEKIEAEEIQNDLFAQMIRGEKKTDSGRSR